MIGFHEGTRRFAECAAGGTLVGVEVGFVEDAWSFGEAFIGSVRLICSRYACVGRQWVLGAW